MLTDCVPSKTLIATAELMTDMADAAELGVRITDHEGDPVNDRATTFEVDLPRVNKRVMRLAADQSADIGRRLEKEDVEVVVGRGSLAGVDRVVVDRQRQGADPARRRGPGRDRCRAARRCRPPSPTASGSSPGSRSTTSTRSPRTSWSSGPV